MAKMSECSAIGVAVAEVREPVLEQLTVSAREVLKIADAGFKPTFIVIGVID